uniref:Phage-related DNA maturase n=1 Tax=uncultured marine virus TaxID=186617 RepID=A0A0F7L9V7_9VIRU|nr:phage-related DNA maturase [uncultured marine virus]
MILKLCLDRILLGGVVVVLDDLRVDNKAVLVKNWFQGVYDSSFLLDVVSDLLDGARVDLREIGLNDLHKHAVTEVTFHHNNINLVHLGLHRKNLENLFVVASLHTTGIGNIKVAVKHLDDSPRGLVFTTARWVHSKDTSSVRHVVTHKLHRAKETIPSEPYVRHSAVPSVLRDLRPHKLFGCRVVIKIHNNKVIDL